MPDRSPFFRVLPWLLGALVLAMGAVPLYQMLRGVEADTGPPVVAIVPEFSLLDSTGATVTRGDLAGRPWVADFVFTRCAGSCPLMTREMQRLGDELPVGVRRVSFSVDPEHDRPAVLADYRAAYGIEDPDWLFLTGGRDEMLELVRGGFLLGVDPDAGTAEEPIVHSARFVLVDGRGRIRGYYDVLEPGGIERLLRDLEALAG